MAAARSRPAGAGYAEELGRDSPTETFAALKIELETWRWAGVPIFLRTGKRMAQRYSEIVVTFKPVPHSIFPGFSGANPLGPKPPGHPPAAE